MTNKITLICAASLLISSCNAKKECNVTSPDNQLTFALSVENGTPIYTIDYNGKTVIKPSSLGFELTDGSIIGRGMRLDSVAHSTFDETWVPVWGENDSIRNHYNQMIAYMSSDDLRLNVEVRVFDDGIGFRYVFPSSGDTIYVAEELTQFAMPSDLTAWWIPGDYDTQEYAYNTTKLSGIRGVNEGIDNSDNVSTSAFSPTGVQTSLLLRDDTDSLYINLHEAALINYPAMHLNLNDTTMVFTSWLTPGMEVEKAKIVTPFATPWRVVMVGSATDILASDIIYR